MQKSGFRTYQTQSSAQDFPCRGRSNGSRLLQRPSQFQSSTDPGNAFVDFHKASHEKSSTAVLVSNVSGIRSVRCRTLTRFFSPYIDLPDNRGVALARRVFQSLPVQYLDSSPAVGKESRF